MRAGYGLDAKHQCTTRPQEKNAMNKDRIAGAGKEIRGTAKEVVGKVTGDAKLEADGEADKVSGKIQGAVGSVRDAVRATWKRR
jgi:uncharacterized protein YjbJ (UPF0337 family)